MKGWHIGIILSGIAILSACGSASSDRTEPANSAANAEMPGTVSNANVEVASGAAKAENTSVCRPVSMPGKVYVADQSFQFNADPFTSSCFVTFANKEDMVDAKDLPRGSTFHIYKDGKKIYDLPDAFAGVSACWVEALSFKDLNGDGKTDVIMAGRCLGARDSYPTNAVYINNGTGFSTDEAANSKLDGLQTIAAIENFIKKDPGDFFTR